MSTNNSNSNSPFEQQLESLYKQRKAGMQSPESLNEKLHATILSPQHIHLNLRGKYSKLKFVNTMALMVLLVIVVAPLFSLIKEQAYLINPPEPVSAHNIHVLERAEGKIQKTLNSALPEHSYQTKPKVEFNSIVADSPRQKLNQFNQQIELFLTNSNLQLHQVQRNLYANAVSKGKLIKQKDMWFIEFCGEQMQLLAMDIIEEHLLANPLLDETREGSFFDVYSNPTGVIAMLQSQDEKQCN